MHLGSCCVSVLLCVCIWLFLCRNILFVLLNSAVISVNSHFCNDFVLFYSNLFTELTVVQILGRCNQSTKAAELFEIVTAISFPHVQEGGGCRS